MKIVRPTLRSAATFVGCIALIQQADAHRLGASSNDIIPVVAVESSMSMVSEVDPPAVEFTLQDIVAGIADEIEEKVNELGEAMVEVTENIADKMTQASELLSSNIDNIAESANTPTAPSFIEADFGDFDFIMSEMSMSMSMPMPESLPEEATECIEGHTSFATDAPLICCPSGDTKRVYTRTQDGWGTSQSRYFCTGLEVGSACGDMDELCGSGACVRGACAATKLGDDAICSVDNDCEVGACGYHYDNFISLVGGVTVCCPSGDTERVYTRVQDGWATSESRYFCTGHGAGAPCHGEGDICASGVCGEDDLCL